MATSSSDAVVYFVPFGRVSLLGQAVLGTVFLLAVSFITGGVVVWWVVVGSFLGYVWFSTVVLVSFEARLDSGGGLEFRGFVRRHRTTTKAVQEIIGKRNQGSRWVVFRFDEGTARMPWAVRKTGLIDRIRELNPAVALSGRI